MTAIDSKHLRAIEKKKFWKPTPQQGWEKRMRDYFKREGYSVSPNWVDNIIKIFKGVLQHEREETLRSVLPKEKGKEAEEKGDMWIEEIKGFNSCRSQIIKTVLQKWNIKL